MANGILIFIAGLIIGGVFVYALINTNSISYITSSKLSSSPSNNTQLNNCLSQVNSAIGLLQAKLASGTQITIVNTTNFGVANNQSINKIGSWANSWYANIASAPAEYCGDGYSAGFLCSDMALLQAKV